jgi:hypothetical protein
MYNHYIINTIMLKSDEIGIQAGKQAREKVLAKI